MAFMRWPKLLKLFDLGHYLTIKLLWFLELFNNLISSHHLPIIMVENDGSVHRANIVPLPIQLSRIMNFEKMLNDLLWGQFIRIKSKLYDFCMTGVAAFYFFILGLLEMSSTESKLGLSDALQHSKAAIDTPVASSS